MRVATQEGPRGQNVYSRAEGIAEHYWPWAVFYVIDAFKRKFKQEMIQESIGSHPRLGHCPKGACHSAALHTAFVNGVDHS